MGNNRIKYTPDLDLLNEYWLPAVTDKGVDFSELYLVSDRGRIRSLKFYGKACDDLISGAYDKDGYVRIGMSGGSGSNYKEKTFRRYV